MDKPTCTVDKCTSPVVARGFCNAHYLRWRNHGDPLGGSKSPAVRKVVDYPDGTRQCTGCQLRKPIEAFQRDKQGSLGRRSRCKDCRAALVAAWYRSNPAERLAVRTATRSADRDRVRESDRKRYERSRSKRIDLATAASHRRRARQREEPGDRGISVASLRKRDGELCCYCGVEMDFAPGRRGPCRYNPLRASIEHRMPLWLGGRHVWENVALCCWQCNVRKGRLTPDEWAAARTQGFDPPSDLDATG